MKCVITGCAFINGQVQVTGDLFQTAEGSWVFVGNKTADGELAWYGVEKTFYHRALKANRWFVRGRVVIIDKDEAYFSGEAGEHLRKWEELEVRCYG